MSADALIADAPIAVRSGRLPMIPWLAALAADGLAIALLLRHAGAGGGPSHAVWLQAAALHLAALLPCILSRALSRSEKALGASLVFAIPLLGGALAALALGTIGRNDLLAQVQADLPTISDLPRVDELRRLGEALPCAEALLAGGAEERRAIIATLTRRADADALALLRWALGSADPELAIDAALAIEEMTSTFEVQLRECRLELETARTPEASLNCAELVTHAIDAGIADPALIPKLAHEARSCYSTADDGHPTRIDVVALGRARLELAVLRPDTALACIDEALPRVSPEGKPLLLALREEAVLASHALPWEGPSALATYQHSGLVPPPLTARRRFGTGRALTGRGTGGVTVGPVQVPPLGTTHKVRRDG